MRWNWTPAPPMTPVLDQHAATLAPILTPDEWSALASLAVQIASSIPDRLEDDDLPREDLEWQAASHIEPDDKEIIGRTTERIPPVIEALRPLIDGEVGTRTQRVTWRLKLNRRTLGG